MPASIHDWDNEKVCQWLSSSGYSKYINIFRANEINGVALSGLDNDSLKELGISSLGQRCQVLKAIFELKMKMSSLFQPADYIPETARFTQSIEEITTRNGNDELNLDKMSQEVQKLSNDMTKLRGQLVPIFRMAREFKSYLDQEKKGTKSTRFPSPIDVNVGNPNESQVKNPAAEKQPSASTGSNAIKVFGDQGGKGSSEPFKNFRIGMDDTCASVLPQALKKYGIEGNWQQYALFISYRDKEYCLSFDEKPLQVFHHLKTLGENPVFVLKHIKQAESPGSRFPEDGSPMSALRSAGSSRFGKSPTRPMSMVPRLKNVKLGLNRTTARIDESPVTESNTSSLPGIAVAIYEYKAARDDELTVNIGDRFNILVREGGWWSVEKSSKTGWVPANCLLEISEAEDMQSERFEETVPSKGIALSEYKKIGPNELNVKEGDNLLVYKKYQHWLLAEKDGIKGWIPFSYVSLERRAKEDFEQMRLPPSPKSPTTLRKGSLKI